MWSYTGFTVAPPFGNSIALQNNSLSNPWANYPGGNPFPFNSTKDTSFPLSGSYSTQPFDFHPTYMNQWNLSIQRQFGTNWLVTANYVGNSTIHFSDEVEQNPAVFLGLGPCTLNGVSYTVCSTTANTNQRRVSSLQNPAQGKYYGFVSSMNNGATANYEGVLFSVQKRFSHGVSVLANHTWSHCISDLWQATLTNGGGLTTDDRRSTYRGNCQTGDTRHAFNLSSILQTPGFSKGARGLRMIASNWQLSPIIQARSAQIFSVTLGVDQALTGGTTQTPNLVGNPYPGNQTAGQWIDRAAFQTPTTGTYGNLGLNTMKGPNVFQFNFALSREFAIQERKSLQLRGEAFNILNHANFDPPVAALNSQTFGRIQSAQDPRILQFALKLIF